MLETEKELAYDSTLLLHCSCTDHVDNELPFVFA